MRMEIDTAEALEALGGRLARLLRAGDFVALEGPLGAGKTTLARGVIRALTTASEEVPSPTFTLVQTYESARLTVAHFDLYRLERAEEAEEIGLWEALDEGAALVEWPERLGSALPRDRLTVEIAPSNAGRVVRLTAHGQWSMRDLDL